MEGIEAAGSSLTALTLQLSSPIEELVLTALQSKVQFTSVETGQATLSATASFSGCKEETVGQSVAHDVAVFTHSLLDIEKSRPLPLYQTDLVVPINNNNDVAICTVTLSITYTPSIKDQRESLFELLEKEANAKAAAREDLRQASLELHQLQQQSSVTASSNTKKSSAVQSGFLNKGTSALKGSNDTAGDDDEKARRPKGPPFWTVWVHRATIVVPVIKNYVIFVGFIVASHYYGHTLAIPAPV